MSTCGTRNQGDSFPVIYNCSVKLSSGEKTNVEQQTFLPSQLSWQEPSAPSQEAINFVEASAMGKVCFREGENLCDGAEVTCKEIMSLKPKKEPEKPKDTSWISKRMARNCAPTYNLREITSYNKYSCFYNSEVEVDGKKVMASPFTKYTGVLPSCDSYENGLAISDQVMEDIRELALYQAGGKEVGMDPDKFHCDVMSVSQL